jgi:hypothetical protein
MSAYAVNRRFESRVPVRWAASCQLGGRFAEGLVRDISGGGVFFTPVRAEGEGEGEPSADGLAFLQPGDTIVLTYRPEWRSDPIMVLATVRWVGFSHDNEVTGAGLKFEHE